MKKFLLALFAGLLSSGLFAQNNFWVDRGENADFPVTGTRVITPSKYRGSVLDFQRIKSYLWTLPSEEQFRFSRSGAPELVLPKPDGSFARFKVWESSLMEPALAARFPEMKTFAGQGIDDPYATIRFDISPFGFHAQVLTVHGSYYIDPYERSGSVTNYISYFKSEQSRATGFHCEVTESLPRPESIQAVCRGDQLRTYRLALACTGEYAIAVCLPNPPTVAQTAAAMLTSVNRVSGVYETELAIRMTLVANNNNLIFLDPNTDPYTNNNGSVMLGQNQTTIDNIIGNANYDIGHVFSTGGGGIAGLGVVCVTGSKARGVTGQPNPVGDPFDIDYVAHEMGHQYGGNHTMAGCGSSPTSTKYEVGSGTTIQAYAGICGAENIQPNSDPFFHALSFDEMINFITIGAGSSCGTVTSTGNLTPVIAPLANNNLTVPPSTPFTLSATATDPNGDPLTYCWEQWDVGGGSFYSWNAGLSQPPGNTVPLFKSRVPKVSGDRTFPDIAVINAGYPSNPPATMGGLKGETLSPVDRPMKFRVTVRDNRAGGGGVASSGSNGCQSGSTTFTINVGSGSPFTVAVPNGGEVWPGNSTQTVTWNVVGTNGAPYNVANVRILLSTDGGLTYPTTVLASTPNDGSEAVTVPNTGTSTAKIKVEAIGNIFFDVSNANFTISAPISEFLFSNPAPVTSACPAGSSMSVVLNVISSGGFSNPVTLTATGNPSGTTVSFSTNPVTPTPSPGTPVTVTLNGTNTLNNGSYVITVTGTATGAPNKTVNLTYTINPGAGPSITAQPAAQTACESSPATFSVTASGAQSYQWQISTDGGASFVNIGGATASSYTIASTTAAMNNYRYRVIVTGQCGTTTSNSAALTVNTAPVVNTHPSGQTVCAGSNASFSVSASGTGLSYQWQVSTDGGSTFNNIAGANASTYTASSTTSAMNGNRYRVVVSGSCSPAATSNAATLTVHTPVSVTTQPASQNVCATGSTTLSVAATGTNPTYQWQLSTDGGASWNNVSNGGVYSGATTSTLTITGATAAMNGYRYRNVVTGTAPCGSVNSTDATLNVTPQPVISAAGPTSLLPGRMTTLSVNVNPAPGLTFTWELNGSPIPGATGNSVVATVNALGNYRVIVTSATGSCTSQLFNVKDSASTRFFIFPSPNNGRFTVSFYNADGTTKSRTVTVYDSRGAKVYNSRFSVSGPYTLLNIDIRDAMRGVYHVVLGDAAGNKIADGRVLIH
ncbi:MAG TPA: zinc-dependent metalloprotease family protein [Chitinophagaceae bacterium]|nr:zinc-dependent metalloprotease family protein [Chitinophagaceae bacterium]